MYILRSLIKEEAMETLYADGVFHGQPVVIVYVNNGHCLGVLTCELLPVYGKTLSS